MIGTATLNFLRMLYIFAGKGFTVIIHGLQRWLQYGIDERNDQAITNNRGLFSKYVRIWQCDRSLLYCCKFPSCLGSSHWWGFVISVNVLRFVPWRITFPKKFILNSIYALRHFGSFYIFLKCEWSIKCDFAKNVKCPAVIWQRIEKFMSKIPLWKWRIQAVFYWRNS